MHKYENSHYTCAGKIVLKKEKCYMRQTITTLLDLTDPSDLAKSLQFAFPLKAMSAAE
jgi:hypothetical protein